jgi:hypothetical protein
MPRITKRAVDSVQADPSGKRFILWDTGDGAVKGFGLLVLPSGVKSYVYDFRNSEGRKRRITIGKHGEYTPDEARRLADDFRQRKKAGGDPLADRIESREAKTVDEILDSYIQSESFRRKALSTQATDRGRIQRHLRPLLGKRRADAVTAKDVERALVAISTGCTATKVRTKARGLARVTGGEGTARMSGISASETDWMT